MIKRTLIGALLGALLSASALAQVNTVPQVGTISAIAKQYSYSASAVGLVPASTATDIFCISPSTSAPQRTIAIKQIKIAGTAGTAITTPFLVFRRASLDTGGTPATSLALPVAGKMNPADPAASAVLTAFTANPTIVDASPVLLDIITPTIAVTTSANTPPANAIYAEQIGTFYHSLVLTKNTTQQVCINLNSVSISSGVLQITIFWTES